MVQRELESRLEIEGKIQVIPFPKSKLNILLFGNGICCLLASAYALAVYTIYKNHFCKWYKYGVEREQEKNQSCSPGDDQRDSSSLSMDKMVAVLRSILNNL
ncbi:MAG: hypothetical protein IT291_09950, partial [Deltaproteobacteria bacterium]|nr:hypothetical protein [Deltaproteobacteria bacterium]